MRPSQQHREPEPEPEPERLALPLLPPPPPGAQSSELEILRLRAKLAAAEQAIAGHRTELVAEVDRRRKLEAQLSDIASGRAVSMEQYQAETWARHAAQREAAQLRGEMDLLRSQEKERHDNAVASLLWLESEAKRGRACVLELQVIYCQAPALVAQPAAPRSTQQSVSLVLRPAICTWLPVQIEQVKHRAAAARVEMLEAEVEMLTKEVRELRQTGAGIHGLQERVAARLTEQIRGGGGTAGAPRPHSPLSSPRALLPQPVADVYDRYSGAGAKANLQAEMKRLEEHKRELGDHQRCATSIITPSIYNNVNIIQQLFPRVEHT